MNLIENPNVINVVCCKLLFTDVNLTKRFQKFTHCVNFWNNKQMPRAVLHKLQLIFNYMI